MPLNDNGSQTSLRRKPKQQSREHPRLKGSDDDSYESSEEILKNDFMVILIMTPKPEEVFCPSSSDYKLALNWYKKISTWQCVTLDEYRMRQLYVSHLSVCFYQKSLRGIFKQIPPEELTWVEFEEACERISPCESTANVNSLPTMTNVSQQSEKSNESCCNLSTKNNYSCGMPSDSSRRVGGSIKIGYRVAHKIPYKTKPKLVPKHCSAVCDSSSLTSSDGNVLYSRSTLHLGCNTESIPELRVRNSQNTKLGPSKENIRFRFSTHRRLKDEKTRRDMIYLLEKIKDELRGQQHSDADDYLELELKRYREYYARHKQNNSDFKSNAESDLAKERIYMLLNMQNDLVKLLS